MNIGRRIVFIPAGTVVSADVTGSGIDVSGYGCGTFQFDWTGLTGTKNAVVKLQQSVDGVLFKDIANATYTMSGSGEATPGGYIIDVAQFQANYIRAVVSHASVSGGSIRCLGFLRSR